MAEFLSIISQNKREPVRFSSVMGARGEMLAAKFIEREGYLIVMANFKVPVGRNSKGVSVTGEIDLIALDGDTLCFIEVKTRRSDEFVPVITNVDIRKQRQITRTAKAYRRIFDVWGMPYRYDVVTVLMPKHSKEHIEVLKDFWNESKFNKRWWHGEAWQGPL